jgi:hypothetical protein
MRWTESSHRSGHRYTRAELVELERKAAPEMRRFETEVYATLAPEQKEYVDLLRRMRELVRGVEADDGVPPPDHLEKQYADASKGWTLRYGGGVTIEGGQVSLPNEQEFNELSRQIQTKYQKLYERGLVPADSTHINLEELGNLKPGTPEFCARYLGHDPGNTPEPIIEQIGPKGAEGLGVVRRTVGTGPDAGRVLEE